MVPAPPLQQQLSHRRCKPGRRLAQGFLSKEITAAAIFAFRSAGYAVRLMSAQSLEPIIPGVEQLGLS